MLVDADADFSAYAAEAWPGLYRRAFLLAGQHADAEDLAQQTLIRARRHWAKVARAESPDAYVTRILTNVFLSSRQRARVTREVLRAVPEASTELQPSPIHGDLWPYLLDLAPRQRAEPPAEFQPLRRTRRAPPGLNERPRGSWQALSQPGRPHLRPRGSVAAAAITPSRDGRGMSPRSSRSRTCSRAS
jgi:DNA-directed RNA polymerase specialized sigma24 family protein